MKFSNTVRRREVAFMIRLLTIFGVVEQRQMRLLFDHMSNRSYGQILARLRQEGLAYFSPDGQIPRNKSILIRSREDAGSHHGFSGHSSRERSCAGFLCE